MLRELEEQRVEATFRCSIYLYCGACLQRFAIASCCLADAADCLFVSTGEVKFNAMSSDASGRLCRSTFDRSVC
ncbi:hypothetical protein A8H39_19665 [Paraburkholderia fungorum]|nr:hypothetical protein A8H39_19665 [Paraburkholderia fungorum]